MSTLSQIREPTPMRTSSGEEHGLMKVVANSVPDSEGKRFKEKDRVAMKKMRDEESRMVKVQYINTKGSQERFERPYMKWDGDPILGYKFIPEYEYEIPKGLVDEVNNKKYTRRSDLLGKDGKPLMIDQVVTSEHRFVPVGF